MTKIIKYSQHGDISNKKYHKVRKLMLLLLVFALILGHTSINKQEVSAKTKELSTSLTQKYHSLYKSLVKNGAAVAYKVKIKKKTIVIHGSLNNSNTNKTSNIRVHTYKLASNVKYVARGGEAFDQEFTKKDFKKYLKRNKNSGLGLVLEFKQSRVVKVAITS